MVQKLLGYDVVTVNSPGRRGKFQKLHFVLLRVISWIVTKSLNKLRRPFPQVQPVCKKRRILHPDGQPLNNLSSFTPAPGVNKTAAPG
jgi:hypothetical protein